MVANISVNIGILACIIPAWDEDVWLKPSTWNKNISIGYRSDNGAMNSQSWMLKFNFFFEISRYAEATINATVNLCDNASRGETYKSVVFTNKNDNPMINALDSAARYAFVLLCMTIKIPNY